jgi:hypothetical protein
MYRKHVPPSSLPSFILPCPRCVAVAPKSAGFGIAPCDSDFLFAGIQPARLANGLVSSDFEDITHRCAQCGATLIRTMRSPCTAA